MHMKRARKEISPSGNKKWVYVFLFSIFLLPFLPSPLSSLFCPPSFLLLLLLSLPPSSPSFFLQHGCIDPVFKNTGFGGKTVRTSRRMSLDTKTEPWAVARDLCHLLPCNHAGLGWPWKWPEPTTLCRVWTAHCSVHGEHEEQNSRAVRWDAQCLGRDGWEVFN